MPNLIGKVAIVTGASQGIGRAIASRLHTAGASVVSSYLPEHGSAEIKCEAEVGREFAVEGDVRSVEFIKLLFEETARRFGPPDIVIANAGINMNKAVVDTTEADFDRMFSVNARGTFFMFREAARQVRDGGR